MVGLVLVSHSRRLAEATVDLIKRTVAADLPLVAAGGIGDDRSELGTDALDIQEAILSVRSPDGVLVLMDMGSAILSAETAKELVSFEMQEPLRLCSAALVEGSIAAAVQIQIGSTLSEIANAAQLGLAPKQDQLGDAIQEIAKPSAEGPISAATELQVVIQNEHGLHLRPAANLIKAIAPFNATVQIENLSAQRGPIAAKSLVDLARLQIRQGNHVRFMVSGPDTEAVLTTIQALAQGNFGETGAGPEKTQAPPVAPPADKPFPVSAGIAIGKPLFLDQIEPPLPSYSLPDEEAVRGELQKLHAALERTDAEFNRRYERLRPSLDPGALAILDAQQLILTDTTIVKEVETVIHDKRQNAAQAWHSILTDLAAEQEAAPDEYLRARAADFREIRSLVLNELRNKGSELQIPSDGSKVILVCDELTPSLVDAIRSTPIDGILQLHGGSTSHGAILARALRLPSIGGVATAAEQIRRADCVAFDGEKGTLWIEPSPEERAKIESERQAKQSAFEVSLVESQQPAKTKDGLPVHVAANAGSREDMVQAVRYGADSVGLFRSEFLFQKFNETPPEDAQVAAYQEALSPIGSRVVTLRLLDIGGDKPLPFLSVPHEANPFLGVRGIRLLFQNPSFFRSHLRAVLRVSAEYRIRLLVPMVADRSEMLSLRKLLAELHEELTRENLPHTWPIPLGAMIETPSAALLVDQLALDCDFLSFGTNDLTQYVLCAERGNPALNQYADALHPAVLRICRQAIEAVRTRKISVSICGEIASDAEALPVLLGIGLREFSVTAASVPNIKSLVRRLDVGRIESRLSGVQHSFATAAEVRDFVTSLEFR